MKTVNMPINVPSGMYCCRHNGEICEHFYQHEGGHPYCKLGFHKQQDTAEGVLKAPKCAALKTSH